MTSADVLAEAARRTHDRLHQDRICKREKKKSIMKKETGQNNARLVEILTRRYDGYSPFSCVAYQFYPAYSRFCERSKQNTEKTKQADARFVEIFV